MIDTENGDPLLCVGGLKGAIRVFCPFPYKPKCALIGHGCSINDLKVHPKKGSVLLSASKDHTFRLWNVNTSVCIAIFGGVEGHRDEVLSAVRKSIKKFSKLEIISFLKSIKLF
jgi:polycomb protein EED